MTPTCNATDSSGQHSVCNAPATVECTCGGAVCAEHAEACDWVECAMCERPVCAACRVSYQGEPMHKGSCVDLARRMDLEIGAAELAECMVAEAMSK